ncbi:ABC transporter substrate-binding protein [Cumulibacter soli]|uniref:ABC transporter substrate-binding protein n=1 Tax=Cumulibacter soli TaxID=2546344 RepID=UPI00106728FC|nr:ABC transporter substrate-binding protein [Cumulibacter soli]
MFRRSLARAAALSTSLLLLAACGNTPDRADGTSAADGLESSIDLDDSFDPAAHFTYGGTAFGVSWDPVESVDGNDLTFYAPVYDRLLRQAANGEIQPMLAEKFTPSEDNTSLTLTLRSDLTFADGTAFDADAVKFNLDRARGTDSKVNGELYQVTGVEVVDDLTVRIDVDGGLGSLAVVLASRPGIMVSPTAAKSGTLTEKPVGIGPYTATQILPGDRVEFEKSADYWDPDAQRVASMTYRLMLDDQTRYNALMAGEVDAADLSADQLNTAIGSDITVLSEPSAQFAYFAVNGGQEPFDDPEVRKALNMSLDREAIAEGLYEGACTPQIQPFPESSPGYSKKIGDGLDIYGYDPEAAKQILTDHDADGLEITSVNANSTSLQQLSEVVQSQLAKVGITVHVKSLPSLQVVQEYAIDKTAEAITTQFTGINDPDALLGRYLAPDALINPGGQDYGVMLDYAAKASATLDPAERATEYEKFMDEWVANPPHIIPICVQHHSAGFAPNVSGVSQSSNGLTDLRGVALTAE